MHCGLILLFCILLSGAAMGQARVEVAVDGIRDSSGVVLVALFRDADSFLKKPLMGKSVKAAAGHVVAVFEGVAPGNYAASIIHDHNKNGKLDTNFFGVPREGFGFSNNAMGTFGPPSFEKATIRVQSSMVIRITARYF
jgi:uncharacterized protein (DUF2141 family)